MTPSDMFDRHAKDAKPSFAKWIISVGAMLFGFGILASANLSVATQFSVLMIGALMFAGGILQTVHAFHARSWPGAVFWTISGLLYGAAGVFIVAKPITAAIPVTLAFVLMLGISGVARIILAIQTRFVPGWILILLSGLISVAASVVVGAGFPEDANWVLGLWLAVDLLFQGAALMMFGFKLRSNGASSKSRTI